MKASPCYYDTYELRVGILEIFDEAAAYRTGGGDGLPVRVARPGIQKAGRAVSAVTKEVRAARRRIRAAKRKAERPPRVKQTEAEAYAQKLAHAKAVRAETRALRERERNTADEWRAQKKGPTVWAPTLTAYRCPHCKSSSATHRCPVTPGKAA